MFTGEETRGVPMHCKKGFWSWILVKEQHTVAFLHEVRTRNQSKFKALSNFEWDMAYRLAWLSVPQFKSR